MEQYEKLPTMGFTESVKTVLSKQTDFTGRARRSELWWYYLLYFIVNFAVTRLFAANFLVSTVVSFLLQLTLFSVTVRRLHDRNISGWLVGIALLIGIASSIYCYATGLYDMLQAVNPNDKELMSAIFNPVFLGIGIVSTAVNLIILVLCVLDGKPAANKYGASTKYVSSEEWQSINELNV